MTPTEELRRMLDERGVEWWEDSFDSKHRTLFDGANGTRYCVHQLGNALFIRSVLPITTPAQAIAATVGAGTCKNDWEPSDKFRCSECGMQILGLSTGMTTPVPIRFCPWCGRRIEVSE